MRNRTAALAFTLLLSTIQSGGQGEVSPPSERFSEQGYVGLALRDIPSGHTIVSWILPGPLNGEGISAPLMDLARPDLLVAVNGEAMNAEQFKEFVRSSSPGSPLLLEYRRSNRRGGTIPDDIDHEDEIQTLEVILDSRDNWEGTIHRGRGHETIVTFDKSMQLDPHDPGNVLGEAVLEHELAEPIKELLSVFTEWLDKNDDFHMLSRVRAGFDNPFCLPELQELVTEEVRNASTDPIMTCLSMAAHNLDVSGTKVTEKSLLAAGDEHDGMLEAWLIKPLRCIGSDTDSALQELAGDRGFAAASLEFLRVPRERFYISGEETRNHLKVIRASMNVDFDLLVSTLHGMRKAADPDAYAMPDGEPIETPAELNDAVDGAILSATYDRQIGWVVVGSTESNRYDMTKIAGVIDPGGEDEYYATDLRLGNRAIVDFAGNDLYTGTPDQGPGSALLGISYIDDRAGDDRYEGDLLSAGAAMYGVSLLLDRGGNDVYKGSEWSLGAGCYGAGMIIDLGSGNDQYLGDFLCEGVGGPRGFGCIIDENGRDLYRANGPTPSMYGTAAVSASFSQGVGFGYRQYAAGGVGLISDLGGDDRYEAGEFAQGGAYYFGLGVLHDAKGRDFYYGNRYGQGFGVHQAVGILADDEGDDSYWSMTAASQGSAWDIGVGLLIDRAGNDSYQCDGLGQGAASMQAIGMLVDLAGTDRYIAGGGATQGQSGGNSYHYHDTGAMSLSLLLDLGGGQDHYSRQRSNNATTLTGEYNETSPKDSSLHGLCVDR